MALDDWYRTGTIDLTNASTAVVGAGTAWSYYAKAGDALQFTVGGVTYLAEVESVESDTALTLKEAFAGVTTPAVAYAVVPVSVLRHLASAIAQDVANLLAKISLATTLILTAGVPSNEVGDIGYAAINTTSFDFYEKQVAGWVLVGSLKGASATESVQGTSATSVTPGIGPKSFVTQAAKDFDPGIPLIVMSAANPSVNWMYGLSSAYNSTTGDLTVEVTHFGGTGPFTDWVIQVVGLRGIDGWTPEMSVATDGARRVLRLDDWFGGGGTKPGHVGEYLGASGFTSVIGDAIDIRGASGIDGTNGTNGADGIDGWSPILATAVDGERRVFQLVAWEGGAGATPGHIGEYLGPSGFTAVIANATDVRGAPGSGSGDVVGPVSSTDGRIALFDGATGKLLKEHTTAPGTMAGQNADSVAITGGAISGITPLPVASGGTGAADAASAQANLGLGTMAVQDAASVTITGGSIAGITPLPVASGGTGDNDAVGARANLGAAALGVSQQFAGNQRMGVTALTPGVTVTPDLSVNNMFTLTPAQNFTLANPINQQGGQSGSIRIQQDGTGSRIVTWGTNWKFPGGEEPALSTAAGAVDRLDYLVWSNGDIHAALAKELI